MSALPRPRSLISRIADDIDSGGLLDNFKLEASEVVELQQEGRHDMLTVFHMSTMGLSRKPRDQLSRLLTRLVLGISFDDMAQLRDALRAHIIDYCSERAVVMVQHELEERQRE